MKKFLILLMAAFGLVSAQAAVVYPGNGGGLSQSAIQVLIDDALAAQPSVLATNDGKSTFLQITNDLGLNTGFRAYYQHTNILTLSEVAPTVYPTDSNSVVRVSADRMSFSVPLTTIYTDGTWPHVSFQSKVFTNSGGLGTGGVFVRNDNTSFWVSNSGPYWITSSTGGVVYTNRTLFGTYQPTSGVTVAGGIWGQTNWFWYGFSNGLPVAFKSNGKTVWSTNLVTGF